MSALDKIAFFQQRRDEEPNQALARELAATQDRLGIQVIAENLWHKHKSVRSDCLGVLYHIGYLNPSLIAGYVGDFLKLLKDKENRMVWGAMIGLATLAEERPTEIWNHLDDIIHAIEHSTLITFVWGIKTLALVAKTDPHYSEKIFPLLLGYLQKCIARDLPLHAESVRVAVNESNRTEFVAVALARQSELTPSQLARLKKLLKML
ncbi:MAG TPA: hypothetical protein PK299_04265 [Anaerolineales bacterium]|nr:hypothetical protein [Anaerolineales bacterium]